ncbi:MAG: fructose-bisphosphate aldolase class I [Actinomycetota bacterium]|nr:fructose-bisphosphate aldolase class I [Actinomycetota bacterium]
MHEHTDRLHSTAQALVAPPRGILAADESPGTMDKRLEKVGVEPTPEARRDYREMLLTTPGLSESASGIILADETFNQELSDGRTVPEACKDAGVLPGIKVDTGAKPLAFSQGETVTEGLDGLRDRFTDYAKRGAAFAKWRAALALDTELPSERAVLVNAHALGRYAALSQEAGIVPIVEPELLMDGDHDLDRCAEATAYVLDVVFMSLVAQGVDLAGIVLKPNMVVAGAKCATQPSVEEAAAATVRVLSEHVPKEVPGIAFLSGGQPPEQATAHLAAMASLSAPWELSFSFGRALVDPALKAWAGDPDRWKDGQAALDERVRANAAARAS